MQFLHPLFPLSAFVHIWHNLPSHPADVHSFLVLSQCNLRKFLANQASSYFQLISSGRHQSLAASAMKCETDVQSHSSD